MSSDEDDELSDLLGPLHSRDNEHEDCAITGKPFSLSREYGARPGRYEGMMGRCSLNYVCCVSKWYLKQDYAMIASSIN